MNCPPVLLIIFNRPDTTQIVFNEIKKQRPKYLFIAADGPRDNQPDDLEKCQKTRSITERIDWDCEVNTLFREKNIGCKYGPSTAIDWFFQHVDRGIILEDDCVPDLTFFPFCMELLELYNDDKRIMMISGCNYVYDKVPVHSSYFFSRYHLIWGWATWKRAWELNDLELKNYNILTDDRYLRGLFETEKERMFWRKIYKIAKDDTLEEWDYKWACAMHSNNGLCICPNVNLIRNVGSGTDATHTKNDTHHFYNHAKSITFPLIHPKLILRDMIADSINFDNFFGQSNFFKKAFKRIKKILHMKNFEKYW